MGNPTAIGSTKSMGWDVLNRMTSFTSGSTTTDYAYRADGMRVSKASGTQAVTYGYDGQMQVEECFSDSGAPSTDYTTRYAIGSRGIDRLETTNGSGTSVGYPVYDSHGNMIATLAESGASYSLGNQRSYDAWGGIRSGSTTGGPSPRHCANLGHVQDDESGFVYMRARYCEPSTARFVAEDPGRHGCNWFAYASNDPVNRVDADGKLSILEVVGFALILVTLYLAGFSLELGYQVGHDGKPDWNGCNHAGIMAMLGALVLAVLLPLEAIVSIAAAATALFAIVMSFVVGGYSGEWQKAKDSGDWRDFDPTGLNSVIMDFYAEQAICLAWINDGDE